MSLFRKREKASRYAVSTVCRCAPGPKTWISVDVVHLTSSSYTTDLCPEQARAFADRAEEAERLATRISEFINAEGFDVNKETPNDTSDRSPK